MGGDRCNDYGAIGVSSQNSQTDFGDDSEEGLQQGMLVVLGALIIGYHWALADKGLCEEAADNNCTIFIRDTNIQTLYRRRADLGLHQFTKVVGPISCPQSDVDGGIVKYRTVSSVKQLSGSSSLSFCGKGEDMIHTS